MKGVAVTEHKPMVTSLSLSVANSENTPPASLIHFGRRIWVTGHPGLQLERDAIVQNEQNGGWRSRAGRKMAICLQIVSPETADSLAIACQSFDPTS
jgi:hypothetical protein